MPPIAPTADSERVASERTPPASLSDDPRAGQEGDAWARIRRGLSLPQPLHPRIESGIKWYAKNPEYLQRVTQRARPYLAYIVHEVERRDMPVELALLPIVESAFKPRAYSRAGASGLWQFMPATGRLYGLKRSWWYDGRRDVVASTRAALDYLTKLLDDFEADVPLAVAAYNWGEGNIRRAVSRNRARGKPADVWSLKLPRETRTHVSRLLAMAAIVAEPDRYGVVLEPIPDRPYFQSVALEGQISLNVAADLAGVPLDELHRLNPGLRRGATDPAGPHRLQIPSHAVERFSVKLAQTATGQWVPGETHRIASGDTLGTIARRYGTSVAALKSLNRLTSDRIYAGRELLLPGSTGRATQLPADRAATKSIYRVRSGDSLWQIARRHGVNAKQLAAWNGLSMQAILHPGQRLTVHRRSTGPARTSSVLSPPEPLATPRAIVHVSRYGESLSGVATPRIVRYQVKPGDSLWEISQRFGVSVADLRKWNRLARNALLMPGRELDVHLSRPPAI